MDASRSETLVQPILVRWGTDTSAIDMIAAAATASALSLMLESEKSDEQVAIDKEWFAGAMTKTVRRVSKPSVWDKLTDHTSDDYQLFIDVPHTVHNSGAVAFPVMKYGELPPVIRRAQVSGTDLAYFVGDIALAYEENEGYSPRVLLHGDLGMSAGKMAAQAAHAACVLTYGTDLHPYDITYQIMSGDEMRARAETDPTVVIHDNGLTEIEAGSLTAIGYERF